jgi:hypothetical protein
MTATDTDARSIVQYDVYSHIQLLVHCTDDTSKWDTRVRIETICNQLVFLSDAFVQSAIGWTMRSQSSR